MLIKYSRMVMRKQEDKGTDCNLAELSPVQLSQPTNGVEVMPNIMEELQ